MQCITPIASQPDSQLEKSWKTLRPRCQELGEVDPRIAVHAQAGCNGRWVAGVAPTLPTAPRRSAGLGLGLGFGISSVKFDPSQDVKQLHHSTAIIPRFTPSSLGVKQLHHSTVHDRVLLLHLSRYRQSGRNEGSTTFTSSATDAPRKALQY